MKLQRASGILLHPTSLPERGTRRRTPTASSTGSPPQASAGGRCCRSGRRKGSPARRTCRRRRSPARPALLAEPDAPVTRRRARRVPARENAYWIDDWIAHGGTARRTRCASTASGTRCARTRRERGVRIFGDMPIYVADGGADHRAHPQLFQQGVVAGVPPDSFAKTGQLWGNPLYDWTAMRADGYRWWIERFRRAFELVDLTRVDHFRGFVSYWAVPGAATRRRSRALAPRPGRRPLPRRRGRARRAARRRRGPRRDHRAGRAPAARARLPGDGRAAVRARRRPAEPAPAARTTRSSRSSTPARTTTTRRAAGGSRCPTSSGRWSELDPDDPAWSLIERRWGSRAALAIAPAAGRARPRHRGAHEPARHRGGQLGLALRSRRADDELARGCARSPSEAGRRMVVPGEGIEPPRPEGTAGFKPAASTSSATPAAGAGVSVAASATAGRARLVGERNALRALAAVGVAERRNAFAVWSSKLGQTAMWPWP